MALGYTIIVDEETREQKLYIPKAKPTNLTNLVDCLKYESQKLVSKLQEENGSI